VAKSDDDQDQVVDIKALGKDAEEFVNQTYLRQEAKNNKDVAEETMKDCTKVLVGILARRGLKTVLTGGWRVTYTPGKNTSISKESLLALGVSAAIIEKATKVTHYETVTVTPTKE
jgi:hypothetical protein